MCGIWFIISKLPIKQEYVRKNLYLLDSIKNRGPDKTIIFSENNMVYGFQRLSIHDVTPLGDQPLRMSFWNEVTREFSIYTLVINGEMN